LPVRDLAVDAFSISASAAVQRARLVTPESE